MDISSQVLSKGAEQGLLGLAFPPGYSTNNHFYVDYTRQTDGAIVIERFLLTSTNSNVADTNSGQILKVISKPNPSTSYINHNAGQLSLGPDGYLYIGVGRRRFGRRSPKRRPNQHAFGKNVFRIDVEGGVSPYAVPTNNPFVGQPGFLPEIWACAIPGGSRLTV